MYLRTFPTGRATKRRVTEHDVEPPKLNPHLNLNLNSNPTFYSLYRPTKKL